MLGQGFGVIEEDCFNKPSTTAGQSKLHLQVLVLEKPLLADDEFVAEQWFREAL